MKKCNNESVTFVAILKGILRKYVTSLAKTPGRNYCPCCNNKLLFFLPGCLPTLTHKFKLSFVPPVCDDLKIIGSDLRRFNCPHCYANDRDRHLMMYIESKGLFELLSGSSVLHFAAESSISEVIQRRKPSEYILCDINPRRPNERKIDMTNIVYPNETFDLVIANHVLEHIPNDKLALSELKRVLKIGGKLIVQTPYSDAIDFTICDSAVVGNAERKSRYGQDDHVRLYGKDVFALIESMGFMFLGGKHDDLLPNVDAIKYGVNPREPFFYFIKV